MTCTLARFDLGPKPGQRGSETWPAAGMDQRGGATDWAGLTLDEQRGIVYVPTGSAVDDLYGADRKGANTKFGRSAQKKRDPGSSPG